MIFFPGSEECAFLIQFYNDISELYSRKYNIFKYYYTHFFH